MSRLLHGVARWVREDEAQSIAETALMLPIMVFLLVGGADVARAYAIQLAVQNGARAGAEATAVDATPTDLEAQDHARQEIARTPGLDPLAANIVMTMSRTPGGPPPCDAPPPTISAPCYVTVRVTYTFRTIVPWPMLPSVFNFDRTTSMRRFS